MKRYWLILSSVFLASCVSNNALQYEAVSSNNVSHMARVRQGMSEKQVLYIMHKPYKYETFEVEDDIYDVWFYVTKTTGLDQSRMVPQNLTPLTFKNGVLVGTGYYWYYFAMREQAADVASQAPPAPKPKSQNAEDKEFEKTLDEAAKPSREPVQPPQEPVQTATGPISIVKPWKAPMSKIQKGMSEQEVNRILGSPLNNETFQIGNDRYDAWFYSNQPPLTFKNGALVGMTMDYYEKVKQSGSQVDETQQRMQEDDSDQNFNFW